MEIVVNSGYALFVWYIAYS